MLHENSLFGLSIRRAAGALLSLLLGLMFSATIAHGQYKWDSHGSPWRADVRDLATGHGMPFDISYVADETRVLRRVHETSPHEWTPTAAINGTPITITCKPDDPSVVLVGIEKYLKRTTNSGATWIDIILNDPTLQPLRLATSPASSQRMYLGLRKVASLSSMRRSFDGGLNWENVSYFFGAVQTHVTAVAPHPSDGLRVWAGGTTPAQLEPMGNFTTTRTNGVFFSTNGGVSWDTSGSFRKDIIALAVYVRSGVTTVLAATSDPSDKLRQTTNNGGTWTSVSFPGGLINDVVVKPFDATIGFVYASAENGFYRSTNYGTSWTLVTTGLYGTPARINVSEPGYVYLGTSANLFRSVDGGLTWSEYSDGISPMTFTGVGKQGSTMLGVSVYPVIKRHAGSGWTTATSLGMATPFVGTSVGFKAATGNTAYATGTRTIGATTRASFLRSTNSGNTVWTEVDTGIGTGRYNGFLIDPINNDRIYVYGKRTSAQNIRVSITAGSTWEDFSFTVSGVAPEVSAMVADPTGGGTQANTLYASVYTGPTTHRGIWKRAIAGSWSRVAAAGDSVAALALNPSAPTSLYAAGKTGSTAWLRRSTDGGSTWTTLTGITGPFTKIVMHPANPGSARDFFVVAENGTKVYRTRNAGITWENLTFDLPVPIHDLRADVATPSTLVAATAGGVYSLPLPAVTTAGIQSPVVGSWNMTSIPAIIQNFAASSAYAGATSAVFIYTPTGYQAVDPVSYGQGHWVKYNTAQTLSRQGDHIQSMWVPVQTSWNIIGMISDPVLVSSIVPSTHHYPLSLTRLSTFFKYNGSYTPVDTLLPGFGYWVKFNQAGLMYLEGDGEYIPGPIEELATFDRFTITDAEGNTQDLYVRNGDIPASLDEMEMPPPPPDAEFDARFTSGDFLRVVDPVDGNVELDIAVEALAYPVTLTWEINPENGITYSVGGGLGKAAQAVAGAGNYVLTTPGEKTIRLAGKSQHMRRPEGVPSSFALHQNYPNPFNPVTTIRFDLPQDARVDLAVFDILGRRVETLVSGVKETGAHSAAFDASGLASGVYFYRLSAKPVGGMGSAFHDIKKLVLVR